MQDADSNGPVHSVMSGDSEFVPLIEAYLAELPDFIAAIQTCIASDDARGMARLAHRLKGSGGGYGYPEITRVAEQAEIASLSGRGWVPSAVALAQLLGRCVV